MVVDTHPHMVVLFFGLPHKLLYFKWSPPWHCIQTFYLALYLTCILTYLLAFYLASILTYFLAFHQAFYLTYAFCHLTFSQACIRVQAWPTSSRVGDGVRVQAWPTASGAGDRCSGPGKAHCILEMAGRRRRRWRRNPRLAAGEKWSQPPSNW